MNLSKVNWSSVLRDGLLFGVSVEAILTVVNATLSQAHIGQGASVTVAGICAVIAAVVSTVARAFAVPVPKPPTVDVVTAAPYDQTSIAGLAAILEALLAQLSPGTSSSTISAFLAQLTGLAGFIIGIVNPSATFTSGEQSYVTLGGLGFLVLASVAHMYFGAKTKAATQAQVGDILQTHLNHVASAPTTETVK